MEWNDESNNGGVESDFNQGNHLSDKDDLNADHIQPESKSFGEHLLIHFERNIDLSGIFNSGDKPQCPSARSLHAKSEKPFIFINLPLDEINVYFHL